MKQSSICFVIPYFGKWPDWMSYFLLGCQYNPSINWVLYSDCGSIKDLPKNVQIVEISYADYCQKVSDALNIKFEPTNPYKLCDIKPCLGFIHKDKLHAYDFWAFGDLDVMYGDLRSYFTEERLKNKSLFSTHARRISGHLCLIKNNEEMRVAFKRVPNWMAMLAKNEHLAFDEKAFSKVFLRHKNSPKWYQAIFKCLDPWLRVAEFQEAFSTPNAKVPWVDGSLNFPKTWTWESGIMTNDLSPNGSFPYFHFLNWKRQWNDDAVLPIIDNAQQIQFDVEGVWCQPEQ